MALSSGRPVRPAFLRTAVAACMLGVAGPAAAQSLDEALAQAYTNNPDLNAERANLRSVDEQVPQALSYWRPSITASGDTTRSRTDYGNGNRIWNTSSSLGISVTQYIYRGGRTTSSTRLAENQVRAEQGRLLTSEQTVLLNAVTAYLDVVRDQSTLDLNINNEQVLRKELEATQDRFRVGEVTRTDVSQAQSNYQTAISQRTQAEGNLRSSRAVFEQIMGFPPGKLSQPKFPYQLPASLQAAVEEAEVNYPAVITADYTERAAREQIDVVSSSRLPQVSVTAGYSRNYPGNSSSTLGFADPTGSVRNRSDHYDNASVTANLSIPLYTGGLVSSQVRQAKQQAGLALTQLESARRAARETAVRAWQTLVADRAIIVSQKAGVEAAGIAAEGTRQEANVGSRTVLDVLTTEQQLLTAQVNLVAAQHDELVAAFTLLSSVGKLTAQNLNLPVVSYNPTAYYDRVHDKWFGTDIDE